MRGILYIIVCCFSVVAQGQISFYKQFSNSGYDFGEGIAQTEDSSYLITGSSSSFGDGPAQAYLLKIDSLGNFLWSRNYGGDESDGGKRVMYIEGDGILIAGFTNSFGNGAYDFYLTKTDTDGNQMWQKSFGTASWDKVNDAALTRDSGVIMVGSTLNSIDGESDILIVRTDKDGNELWSQQLGGVGEDMAMSIEQMDDSTFAVGGKTYVEDSLQFKALVFSIRENNDILWMDTIGPNGNYIINDMSFDPVTNNLAMVGAVTFPNGEIGIIENKCTKDGVLYFENYASPLSIQYNTGIAPLGNAGKFCVVNNFDNQYSYGQEDLTFNQCYNYIGYENSLAAINYAGNETLGQLIACSDLGVIAVGSSDKLDNGGSTVFVIKLLENKPFFNVDDSLDIQSIVSIQTIEQETEISIYPNPVHSILRIETDNSAKIKAVIRDNTGRVSITQLLYMSNSIDVNHLRNGLYQLELFDEQNRRLGAKRFIVTH